MRSIAVLFALSIVAAACEKGGEPAPSVKVAPAPAQTQVVTAQAPGAVAPAVTDMVAPVTRKDTTDTADTAATTAKPEGGMCGGGESCCGGMVAETTTTAPLAAEIAADAVWTELHVTGMHCGDCARRIERTLREVDGVVGVTADQATGLVRVAMAPGTKDARAQVAPRIDALGYHVAP
jgi:copper chaperone CopZ